VGLKWSNPLYDVVHFLVNRCGCIRSQFRGTWWRLYCYQTCKFFKRSGSCDLPRKQMSMTKAFRLCVAN
jgi:hypothetical protein